MKLPYICLKPLLMGSSAWHDFAISDNPSYLYSCPSGWPQLNCTSHPWEEGWPRAMPCPWCSLGKPTWSLHSLSPFTSAAQPAVPGLAQPSAFNLQLIRGNLSQIIPSHLGGQEVSPALALLLPQTNCAFSFEDQVHKASGAAEEEQRAISDGRHWQVPQPPGSPCSELWGEVPWTSFACCSCPICFLWPLQRKVHTTSLKFRRWIILNACEGTACWHGAGMVISNFPVFKSPPKMNLPLTSLRLQCERLHFHGMLSHRLWRGLEATSPGRCCSETCSFPPAWLFYPVQWLLSVVIDQVNLYYLF